MPKVYGMIFKDYCTQAMQYKIKVLENFESEIKGKPSKLVAKCRALMRDPSITKYHAAKLHDDIKGIMNLRQRENEDAQQYVERAKAEWKEFKDQMGDSLILEHVQKLPAFKALTTEEERLEMVEEWQEMF